MRTGDMEQCDSKHTHLSGGRKQEGQDVSIHGQDRGELGTGSAGLLGDSFTACTCLPGDLGVNDSGWRTKDTEFNLHRVGCPNEGHSENSK